MIRFAKLVSLIFNPVVFFLIMPFLIVYHQTQSGIYAFKWGIFSLIFPAFGIAFLLIGRISGVFSDEDISVREERHRFYIILYSLAFLYFIIALFLKGIFFPLSIITFGIILGILIFNIFNYYIKASIHIGVACAFVVTIGILYGFKFFLITAFIIPVLAWSRVVMKRHTFKEIIIGGTLGVLITIVTFLIGKQIYNY